MDKGRMPTTIATTTGDVDEVAAAAIIITIMDGITSAVGRTMGVIVGHVTMDTDGTRVAAVEEDSIATMTVDEKRMTTTATGGTNVTTIGETALTTVETIGNTQEKKTDTAVVRLDSFCIVVAIVTDMT